MSDKRKRSGGLGKNAFFHTTDEQTAKGDGAEAATTTIKEPEVDNKPQKVRTTVMLYPETMAGLEALKTQLRKHTGKMVTYSDVLNEAIQDLMNKKGINLEL